MVRILEQPSSTSVLLYFHLHLYSNSESSKSLLLFFLFQAILCIPFSFISNLLLQYWPFGPTLCSLVSYSQAVSVFVSAYTLGKYSLRILSQNFGVNLNS